MRICFVVSQIFAWGKYGGFGSMTRAIASGLVEEGIEVYAVVPRRYGQKGSEKLDGINVLSFPLKATLFSSSLYTECDADIYHSQEPSLGTYLAMKAMPQRKHVITCIDPRNASDWRMEYSFYSPIRKILFPLFCLYENNFLVTKAVKKADKVFCQARFIAPKAKKIYGLGGLPAFLPNPVVVPERPLKKAKKPTVCFLARWDARKRPEIFFNLAKEFSDIEFIAMGRDHDHNRDKMLRKKFGAIPNLKMPGFLTGQKKERVLERSWIMINTAAREGLPAAFVEAAAFKCAILSNNDPDQFSSQFGYWVKNNDFQEGIKYLIRNERWRQLGEQGYNYVKSTYEYKKVIKQHITIYNQTVGA